MHKKEKTPQRLFGCAEQASLNTLAEIEFCEADYATVWCSLLEVIGERNYFNGTVECAHEAFTSRLTTTLIIYRDRTLPDRPITSIVPIWWEMHTFDADGNQQFNDFSLKELLSKVN